MANEMKIKNGLIVQGQISATAITASTLLGTASYANIAGVANTINFVPTVAASASVASASINALTASYVLSTNVIGTVVSATSASYAATSSWTINATTATSATSSSYSGTASVLLGSVVSSSAALTASYSFASATAQAISFVPTVAISASAASSSISASFAQTASSLTGWNFNNTGSILSNLNTQTVVISLSTGSFIAAFFDYAAVSASNVRAGTVFGSWINGQITFSEISNVDVGDTSAVTMSMGLVGSIVQLSSSVSTVPWTIKALGRYI